jgi:hypothetical protein
MFLMHSERRAREFSKELSIMKLMRVNFVSFCALLLCMVTIALLRQYCTMPLLPYHMLEKETVLHFFLHDTPGGSSPSAVRVVQANGTVHNTSLTPFGTVWVVDDPLTEGPDPKSTILGNSRGVYVSAGQDELMLVAYLDFGFTSGEFNGSSLSVLSRNTVTQIEREFAVVGGRGKFRMARGFANLKCIFFNESNGDSIVEYTMVVRHY